ncbi:ATP-binding protein [Streptomyces sp. NPDC050560]|uniref:ATP-binding protein n=1 Tax=Streptomyces sp. NPDC050560 TaxID=3365630 RepID=UPI00379C8CD8
MSEYGDGAASTAPYDVPVDPLRRTTQYTGEPGCIADARGFAGMFVEQLAAEWCAVLDDRARGDILLIVSELVTNADVHSHGPYVLELEGTDESVTVTVYDSSATLPHRYPADPGRIGGHGLEIVHVVADEVSVERIPVGKRVRAVLSFGR